MNSGSSIIHNILSYNVTDTHIYNYLLTGSNMKNYFLLSTMDTSKGGDYGAYEIYFGEVKYNDNNISNTICMNYAAENLWFGQSNGIASFSNCFNNTSTSLGMNYHYGNPYSTMKYYSIISNKITGSNGDGTGIVSTGFHGLKLSNSVLLNNISPNLFYVSENGFLIVDSTYINGNSFTYSCSFSYSGGSFSITTTSSFNINFKEYTDTDALTFIIMPKKCSNTAKSSTMNYLLLLANEVAE